MDIHSGVFTAPLAGVYLFLLHIATHDNKKALLSIRRNGEEIASVFDQNHKDNHKNSMAGQNLLLDCQRGDEVREVSFDILVQVPVYVYNCTITRRKNFVLLFCFFDSPQVAVYAYTGTWLADFPMNHYTHWVGILIKPSQQEVAFISKFVRPVEEC